MADDKDAKDFGDIDDWLADLDDDDETPAASEAAAETVAGDDDGELDQSDIDQLLSGGGNDDAAGDGDDSVELDQSDIDSLFGDVDQEEVPAPAAKPEEEAAGGDLDELFGDGLQDEAEAAVENGGLQEAAGEEEPASAAPEAAQVAEPQEAAAGREESAESPESNDPGDTDAKAQEAAGGEQGKDPFDFDDGEFDFDGFDFDDSIPDIPDENMLGSARKEGESGAAAAADDDIFADTPTPPPPGAEGAAVEGEEADRGGWKKYLAMLPLPGAIDRSAINKSTIGASVVSLLLLVGAVYLFLGRGEEPEPAIPPLVREQMVEALEPEAPAPEAPPRARGDRYRMEERGAAVSMRLRAEAVDDAPLAFEIVSGPQHGRLSGEPPRLTYLPNPDFPGEDRFTFRAGDGRLFSESAQITVVGPSLRAEVDQKEDVAEVDEVVTLTPARAVVRARDLVMRTRSTDPLEIDWAAIWRRDNAAPFSQARVEIIEQELVGRLSAPRPGLHRYQPDPYFQGEERLTYRFHYGGQRSKPRRLTLRVELGDPPPSIRLRPLAEAYPTGETVVIDARDTLASRPGELHYEWQQLSGAAIHLESLAENNAVVRFVAPSSFSGVTEPKVMLQVTATDPAGQRDSQTVEISTPSRRQNALWQGEGDGGQRRSPLWGY